MNDLMLYLHFPFCKRKCKYCDFYSVTKLDFIDAYCDKMLDDISAWSKKAKDRTIGSVYFGGGTPSLMGSRNAERILSEIFKDFNVSNNAEITFEVNPESTDKGLLFALHDSGVNRISMGVQSSSNDELDMIGRLHSFETAKEKVLLMRECGFDNYNLDLMYGLPNQSFASWQRNLESIISLEPKHISFYALTLSENVPLYKMSDRLPNDDLQRKMYLFASDHLEKCGYEHYEISNAAKKDCYSRHNSGYWERKEYIGLGCSAHSFFGNKRFLVSSDVNRFILETNREKLIENIEELSIEDEYTEYVFLSLRTKKGIDLKYTEDRFGREKAENCRNILEFYIKHSLTAETGSGYRLTPEGFFVSDSIITKIL